MIPAFFDGTDLTKINKSDDWEKLALKLYQVADKAGVLCAIERAKTCEEKVAEIMANKKIRKKLAAWISKYCDGSSGKCGATAERLRDEGNAMYRAHNIAGSLRLYTKSIVYSPEDGPELSLAFANRSAALYHSGLFEDCLRDIELAIKYGYPADIIYKLYQRRGLCYTQLGKAEEALKAFKEAIGALDFVAKMTEEKKKMMVRDIKALESEAESGKNVAKTCRQSASHPLPPTTPAGGHNPKLPGGSSHLSVKQSACKGRYVVSEKPVKVTDVLFTEMPYASILYPNRYADTCYHCLMALSNPIPCLKCTRLNFCSEVCRMDSWSGYHQYECEGLDLLFSVGTSEKAVGLAHLGLRMVLVTGMSRLSKLRSRLSKAGKGLSPTVFATDDPYLRVHQLVHHLNKKALPMQFAVGLIAVLFGLYLDKRTQFMSGCDYSSSDRKKDELQVFVCSLILQHMTQVACNAIEIYFEEFSPSLPAAPSNINDLESLTVKPVGLGIYPSACMMNHSCDPTVARSFYGRRLIYRAIKAAPAGSEVFNCYVPTFRHATRAERTRIFATLFYFTCTCLPCRKPTDFLSRFKAFRCRHCKGPVMNLSEDEPNDRSLECRDCGQAQTFAERNVALSLAENLHKKGMAAIECGNMAEASTALESCFQIRANALHDHNIDTVAVAGNLYWSHALTGNLEKSLKYLKVVLQGDKERYGVRSRMAGCGLVQCANLVWWILNSRQHGLSPGQFAEKHSWAVTCLKEASEIFQLVLGQWHPVVKEVEHRLAQMKLVNYGKK